MQPTSYDGRMKRVSFDDMTCSIARAVDVVGEWWTPLIVREVAFGHRRFDEIQRRLGISRNILTDRLNRLVDEGVLERRNIARTGTRHEYRLTEAGQDLTNVLTALKTWGDRWRPLEGGPPVDLEHTTCGHRVTPVLTCPDCGGEMTPATTRARIAPGWEDDPTHPLAPSEGR